MKTWKPTRTILLALAVSLGLATAGFGFEVENILVSKISETRTLNLEDGVTVKVSDSTEIRTREGERVSFADIPNPEDVAPGHVGIKVEGSKSGNTINASKVTIQNVLMN
ncbi:MAG: hypothetical protein CL910_13695 [Deltaproteobacteria bacterium]|jgi:hypothetical protein|nr:hypothetical protein [Deltaproteobacteria bacterium]